MQPSEILTKLLVERGITPEEHSLFIEPDFTVHQHDGAGILGMDVAVQRVQQAIARQEKVMIFGDYDADGVPATALLVRGLQKVGVNVESRIPLRADGYGLTMEMVMTIVGQKPDLLITVDNGTVAADEIAALKSHDIETIVIDHHEVQEGHLATEALAILNPKQPNCSYPFKELCGCGLAWKFLVELYKALGENPEQLKWQLDLVAVSTIADLVPLVGENRVLTKFGLRVLQKSRNLGLRALAGAAGVPLEAITSGDVAFKIAPRINAPSRMHQEKYADVHAALQLLVTENEAEALTLAQYLNEQNGERQALVERHLDEAMAQAQEQSAAHALIVYGESWSTGVIGLVASKLVELYKRPVVALAMEGDSIKGSVRSVGEIHAIDLLNAGEQYLERFGGHAKAAGLTMKKDVSVEAFRGALQTWTATQTDLETLALSMVRKHDIELDLEDVTIELATALENLAPYGLGFPTPIFAVRAKISDVRTVGKTGKHLACFLEFEGVRKKGIAFGQANAVIRPNEVHEVHLQVAAETWNQITSPVCQIVKIVP